jgi:hypothetical protein
MENSTHTITAAFGLTVQQVFDIRDNSKTFEPLQNYKKGDVLANTDYGFVIVEINSDGINSLYTNKYYNLDNYLSPKSCSLTTSQAISSKWFKVN